MSKATNTISKRFKLNKSLVSRDTYSFQKEVIFDVIKTFLFKRGFLISDLFIEERRRSLVLSLTFFPYAKFVPSIFQMFALKKMKKHKTRKKLVSKQRHPFSNVQVELLESETSKYSISINDVFEGLKVRALKLKSTNNALCWDAFPDPFYVKTNRIKREKDIFFKYWRNKGKQFRPKTKIENVSPSELMEPFIKRRKITKHFFTQRQMFWNTKRKADRILRYELGLYTSWPKNKEIKAVFERKQRKVCLWEKKGKVRKRNLRKRNLRKSKTFLFFNLPRYAFLFGPSFRDLQKLDHGLCFEKSLLNYSVNAFVKSKSNGKQGIIKDCLIEPATYKQSGYNTLLRSGLLTLKTKMPKRNAFFNKKLFLTCLLFKPNLIDNFSYSFDLKPRKSVESSFPTLVSLVKTAFGSNNIVLKSRRFLWFDMLLSNGAYEYKDYNNFVLMPITKKEKYCAFKRFLLPFLKQKRSELRKLFFFTRPFYFYRSGVFASFLLILFYKVDPSNLLYIFSKLFKRVKKKRQKFFISRLANILKALVSFSSSSSLSWARIRILGVKLEVNGRIRGKLKASTLKYVYGLGVPGQTQSALMEYYYHCFKTRQYGTYGFKVWIYHEKRPNVLYF